MPSSSHVSYTLDTVWQEKTTWNWDFLALFLIMLMIHGDEVVDTDIKQFHLSDELRHSRADKVLTA